MSKELKTSNICSICKKTGTKEEIPYKIIRDTDGMSVKFIGAICNECYDKVIPIAKLYNMAMDMATKYVKATQDDDSFAEFITMFDKLFNQIDLTN